MIVGRVLAAASDQGAAMMDKWGWNGNGVLVVWLWSTAGTGPTALG